MGIIKSLEGASEEMRLHEMTVQETSKKPELLFDVEAEITEDDWESWKATLANLGKRGPDEEFLGLAAAMQTIFPERKDELGLETYREEIKEWFEGERKRKRETLRCEVGNEFFIDSSLLDDLVRIKKLFPEILSEINLGIFRERLEGGTITKEGNVNLPRSVITLGDWLYRRKILFPDSFDETMTQKSELREIIKKNLANQWKHVPNISEERYILGTLAGIKIFAPDLVDELYEKPALQDLIRRQIQQERSKIESSQEVRRAKISLAEDLAWAKIMSAKEVRMTDKGLVLVMPEEKHTFVETKPRPVRREF